MKRAALVVAVLMVLGPILSQAQSPVPTMNPIIGNWKVNLEKSTYFPGPRPAPGAGGRNYIDRGNGVVAEVRLNIGATGAPALANLWSGKLDGTATPVFAQGDVLSLIETGMKPAGTRSYKVIDPLTLESTNKAAPAGGGGAGASTTATLVVSRDGKTLTETIKNFNPQGQQVGMNVVVYDRQ